MKHLFTFAFTALVALMSLAPNTATAQATEPIDTIELRFKSFYQDPLYLAAGDWTITLKNDVYQFTFDFFGGTPDDPSGTYTEADMDLPFSTCFFPTSEGTNYYKTCKLTIKKEKLGQSLCKYVLDAEVVTSLGLGNNKPVSGAFKIHAEHEIIIPVKKYDEAIYFSSLTLNEKGYTLAGKNDTMDVNLDVLTTEGVTPNLTHKMLDATKTKLVRLGTSYKVISMEGEIFSAPNMYNNITYVAMMEIVAGCEKDTVMINLAMEAPVTPVKTVDVFCQNLSIDESRAAESVITLLASNNQYSIEIGCNDKLVRDSATYAGTMGAGSIIKDLARDKTISGLSTTVTLVGSKSKGYTATARVFSEEHICYNLHLTNIIQIIDTVDIQFTNNSKAMYDIDELGLYELQMANTNANYSVAFDILNIDRILLTEEFHKNDLFIDKTVMATYLVKHTDKGDVNVEMIQVNGSIKQKNDSTFLNATIHGLDSILYNVSMFYTVPTPVDTVECTFSEDLTEFENALPQGIFILGALTDDGQIMCNIQVNRIATGTIEGTFICDGHFEENQFEPFETYVGTLKDASKMEFDAHYMQKGEMTASIDSLGKVHATAKFICDNAVLYILHFNFTYVRPRLPYDTEDEGVNTTIGKEAKVKVYDEYFESDGYIEYVLYVENPFNELDLVFFIDEKDPDIVIPVGVYPFGVFGSKNHVLASRGMTQDNTGMYPLPSYYQTLDELGQPHGYFLVDGTVTVEKVDGHIVMYIDAVNSYDLPVKITYDPSKTAVENVENTPSNSIHKQLINGQLLIIRNNEVYTATGVRVK